MITLQIPRVPCSPNDLLGYHWRHRQRNSKLWQQEIGYALIGRKPAQPFPRAYIAIDRCGHGELDEDNLVASVKPIIDALRYAKVLVDDSPRHMTLRVTQSRCSPKVGPSTRIEIIPIESTKGADLGENAAQTQPRPDSSPEDSHAQISHPDAAHDQC